MKESHSTFGRFIVYVYETLELVKELGSLYLLPCSITYLLTPLVIPIDG